MTKILIALLVCLPISAQVQQEAAGPISAMVIDISSLGLDSATLGSVSVSCDSGTGFSGGHVTGDLSPITQRIPFLTDRTTSSVTANFSRLRTNVVCRAGVAGSGGASGAVVGTYTATISPAATTWTIAAAAHNLNTCSLAYAVWVGGLAVEPDTVTCNPSTYALVLTFSSAQTGNIIISSDPVVVGDTLPSGSLVTQTAGAAISGASLAITHNLNGTVFARCYSDTGQRIGYSTATATSSNITTFAFVGSAIGHCIVGR